MRHGYFVVLWLYNVGTCSYLYCSNEVVPVPGIVYETALLHTPPQK